MAGSVGARGGRLPIIVLSAVLFVMLCRDGGDKNSASSSQGKSINRLTIGCASYQILSRSTREKLWKSIFKPQQQRRKKTDET